MPDRDRGLFGPSGRQLGYALGILLLIVLIGLSAPNQDRAGSAEPHQARAGQEQTTRQPATPPDSAGDTAAEQRRAAPEQADNEQIGPVRWLIRAALEPDNFANFLIMLFTMALTIVGVLEFLLLRRSTEESAAAIEIARRTAEATSSVASGTMLTGAATAALANAAEKSAAAVAEANQIARDFAESQLRPWVDVEIVKVTMSSSTAAFQLYVDLRLTNLGKSPAVHIQTRARIITATAGRNAKMGDLFPAEGKHPHVQSLLPGGVADKHLLPRVPAENIAMMTISTGGKVVAGPHFSPRLRVIVEYQWGSPVRHGKTVKNFAISGVSSIGHTRERVAYPVRLGEMPVSQLTAFEIDVSEVS